MSMRGVTDKRVRIATHASMKKAKHRAPARPEHLICKRCKYKVSCTRLREHVLTHDPRAMKPEGTYEWILAQFEGSEAFGSPTL